MSEQKSYDIIIILEHSLSIYITPSSLKNWVQSWKLHIAYLDT